MKRIFPILVLAALAALILGILSPEIDLMARPLEVQDHLQEADVIVALSSGKLPDCQAHPNFFIREARAAQLLKDYYSTSGKLIVSGVYTRPPHNNLLPMCKAKMARMFGIAPQQLVIDNTAETTLENARHIQKIMKDNHWKTAVLVTSRSHMFRAYSVFKKLNMTVYPVEVPDYPPYGNDWISRNRLQHIKRFIYEYGALIKYRWYGYI